MSSLSSNPWFFRLTHYIIQLSNTAALCPSTKKLVFSLPSYLFMDACWSKMSLGIYLAPTLFQIKFFSHTHNWFWCFAIKKPGETDRAIEPNLGRNAVKMSFIWWNITHSMFYFYGGKHNANTLSGFDYLGILQGKNIQIEGKHRMVQITHLNQWVEVAQLCPTLCDPMDYTVHRILQTRILQWVAFPFSRGSFQPRDGTRVSHIAGRFFTSWASRETEEYRSG